MNDYPKELAYAIFTVFILTVLVLAAIGIQHLFEWLNSWLS